MFGHRGRPAGTVQTVEPGPRWPRFDDEDRTRVLIEHPDPAGQRVLAEAFRARGYQALTCGGPQAAGVSVADCPMLTDGYCPAVDGADVVVSSLHIGRGLDARIVEGIVADPTGPPVLLEASGWQLQQADLQGPVEATSFPFLSPASVVDQVDRLLAASA